MGIPRLTPRTLGLGAISQKWWFSAQFEAGGHDRGCCAPFPSTGGVPGCVLGQLKVLGEAESSKPREAMAGGGRGQDPAPCSQKTPITHSLSPPPPAEVRFG